jgi:FdhE protein
MTAPGALDALKRQRPEWSPWLAVVEEILGETASTRWDAAVPNPPGARGNGTPLVSGSSLSVDPSDVRRVLKRAIRAAARTGAPKMASLKRALDGDVDVLALLAGSLRQQDDPLAAYASACGADPEAFQAVAALLAVPVLHACRRRWASSIPPSWMEGYCPVCGSWPAFAEVRGIERTRYLRCGRCGGEWLGSILRCACCGTTDHEDFVSLVSEQAGSPRSIEACRRCHGYVKTFTRLQGCAPSAVMLEDLASVDLDVAALEQGYTKPPGAGYAVDVTIGSAAAKRAFLAWHT